MMNLEAGLVAVAALTLSPIAHAQISCSQIDELIELAWDDFGDIAGEEVEDDVFAAEYLLDGALQCTVTVAFVAEYACLYTFPDEAEAAGVYARNLARFGTCLAGWTQEEYEPITPLAEFTQISAQLAVGPGDLANLEWFVSLERHNRPEGPDWHVVVALSYF